MLLVLEAEYDLGDANFLVAADKRHALILFRGLIEEKHNDRLITLRPGAAFFFSHWSALISYPCEFIPGALEMPRRTLIAQQRTRYLFRTSD